MKKIWTWDKFYGGESDQQRQFTDSDTVKFQSGTYNVDVRSEPDGVKLMSDATVYGDYDALPISMLNLAEYGSSGIVVVTDNGKIYLDGTLKHTLSTAKDVTAMFVMTVSGTQYIYYVATDKLHRSPLNISSVTESHKTFDGESGKKFVIRYAQGFYFTGGNHIVHQITTTDVVTEALVLPTDGYITGFTAFQDQYKIYWTNDGGNRSRQYVTDFSQTEPNYYVDFNENPIYGAVNVGSSDFIVTGSQLQSDLYEVSGTTSELRVSNFEGKSNQRRFFPSMATRKKDAFIASYNGVYRYGNYYPGYPKALTLDFKIEGTSQITFIYIYGNILYVGWEYNNIPLDYKIYQFDLNTPPSTFVSSGEIVSLQTDMGDKTTKKTLIEIAVALDSDASNPTFNRGGNITLYSRKKTSSAWTTIKTFSSTVGDNFKIMASELNALGFGDFENIEFKAKLERGSTSKSPFFKGIKVTYEDNVTDR